MLHRSAVVREYLEANWFSPIAKMGYCLSVLLLAVIVLVRKFYKKLSEPKPVPHLDFDTNWTASQDDRVPEARPFAVADHSEEIVNIQRRIDDIAPKLPSPLHGAVHEYGLNSVQFREFLSYWRDDYLPRWPERVAYLNRFPQYTQTIQGLNIHYIHTNAATEAATALRTVVPILLVHGWPGSVREFFDIIPRLSTPDAVLHNTVFTVVAPSLPGFAWSEAATRTGLGAAQTAVVLRNLMLRLGYERFYVQGGDWGSSVGSAMATLCPDNVIGFHSNMLLIRTPMSMLKECVASVWPSLFVFKEHQSFFFPAAAKWANVLLETGYMHLQASKPDTIGLALTDNPVGVAAYVLEKFLTWTDPKCRSAAERGWPAFDRTFRDAILDNIMIYVLSSSMTSSMRLYAESFAGAQSRLGLARVPTAVPTACARFANDVQHSMDWQLQEKYRNIVQSTYHRSGGHFAAMEQPDLLFGDLVEFIRSVNRVNKMQALL